MDSPDDVHRGLLETLRIMAEAMTGSHNRHVSRMSHPTRPPQTVDELQWEQELGDIPR